MFFDLSNENESILAKFSKNPPSIVAAVSGGMDSMAMLEYLVFLHESRFIKKIHVYHANYQLRGQESHGDEEFVRQYCKEKGLPFYTEKFDYNKKEHGNLQGWARAQRYKALAHIVTALGENSVVATAHHLDDCLETYFMKIANGTPLFSLHSAIVSNSDRLWRPFFNITKKQISDYVERQSLRFRRDSSNESLKYRRNQVRARLEKHWQMAKTHCQKKRDLAARIKSCSLSLHSQLENSFKELKNGTLELQSLMLLSPRMQQMAVEKLIYDSLGKVAERPRQGDHVRDKRHLKHPAQFATEVLTSAKRNRPFLKQLNNHLTLKFDQSISSICVEPILAEPASAKQHPLFLARKKKLENLRNKLQKYKKINP